MMTTKKNIATRAAGGALYFFVVLTLSSAVVSGAVRTLTSGSYDCTYYDDCTKLGDFVFMVCGCRDALASSKCISVVQNPTNSSERVFSYQDGVCYAIRPTSSKICEPSFNPLSLAGLQGNCNQGEMCLVNHKCYAGTVAGPPDDAPDPSTAGCKEDADCNSPFALCRCPDGFSSTMCYNSATNTFTGGVCHLFEVARGGMFDLGGTVPCSSSEVKEKRADGFTSSCEAREACHALTAGMDGVCVRSAQAAAGVTELPVITSSSPSSTPSKTTGGVAEKNEDNKKPTSGFRSAARGDADTDSAFRLIVGVATVLSAISLRYCW